jgi:hypothetical protein
MGIAPLLRVAASQARPARFAARWKLGLAKEFTQIFTAFLLENKGIRG